MAEHAELVREMVDLEKLTSAERLKLAKVRRQKQLKKFSEHEKKHDKQEKQAQKRKAKAISTVIQTSSSLALQGKPKTNSYPPHLPPDNADDQRQNGVSRRIQFDRGVILLEAAARNDINEVRGLLKGGVSPDVANEDGLTALHQCCIDDSEDMLLLLLEYGANVNSRDSEMWTPLHAASTCAHLQICQHLLNKSADLLAVNADGNMPYDICDDEATLEFIETAMSSHGITQELIDETRLSTEMNMLEDIKKFEREGNTVFVWKDRTGATLLHIAAANGYYDVTSYLLTKRFDVNIVDGDGWTPAMAAACWGQIPVLELLAKNGADLDVKTKDNKSLVDLVDDLEVKDQITEIRQEIKLNLERFKRDNMDVRRRSSTNIRSTGAGSIGNSSLYNSNTSLAERNPFSSSVRRHSMREKHKLSMQEARDEARFRISINTEDSIPSSTTSSTHADDSEKSAMPVTNIDDIDMEVTANNITTITINNAPPPDTVTSQGDGKSVLEATEPIEPQTKLVATIQIDGGDTTPIPAKQDIPSSSYPAHMNGDRNSNGGTIRVDSLKGDEPPESSSVVTSSVVTSSVVIQSTESDTESTDESSKYQQNVTPSSHTNPVMQHYEPPLRRYTAYNRAAGGHVDDRPKKGCCIIC